LYVVSCNAILTLVHSPTPVRRLDSAFIPWLTPKLGNVG
jgi:hypothetical protein